MTSAAPDGRRMLRVEVRNAQTPIERKPEWIRTTAKMGPEYRDCLLYTSPSPRDKRQSRMPSSA